MYTEEKTRKGLGIKLMEGLETLYTSTRAVALDTPIWNIRTNNFYRKLGYDEVRRDDEMVFYKKIIVM